MRIYIPSRARADQRAHTWDSLPPAVQANAYFLIGPGDVPAYCARFPEDHVLMVDFEGIGKVRQHVIDISDGPVLMLDDDLSFFVRRKDDPKLLTKASPRDVGNMIKRMEATLRQFAHAAIAVREGANRNTDPEILNIRCLRALGYNASVLKKEGVRFDRLPVMEDFDVALQLLRKGYPSLTLNTWCQDQGASNAPGGCSTYRTMKRQAAAAEGLGKLHPGVVTVVTKNAKSKGAWAERRDVRVQWKKAFEESQL